MLNRVLGVTLAVAAALMEEIRCVVCQGQSIAEIVAENGKPVQFGQVLFRVK